LCSLCSTTLFRRSGQSYSLFDAGTLEGAFASFTFTLAPLQSGLFWDTSNLATTGTLAVSAVPEPSGLFLFVAWNGCLAVSPKTRGYAADSLTRHFKKERKQRRDVRMLLLLSLAHFPCLHAG
jgi:hypothetical protein